VQEVAGFLRKLRPPAESNGSTYLYATKLIDR